MDKKRTKNELNSFQETKLEGKYKNISFTIILVRPEHAGNIGSIARVMKNFNFEKLVIFNPLEKIELIKSYESQGFAMHGKDILLNAEIFEVQNKEQHITELTGFLKKFDLIIGTTARGMRNTNIRRLAIFPDDLIIPVSEKPLNIAILFGRESRGLTNEEISCADIILRIPASNEYSALNLSHACGIILYEIFKKINILNIGRGDHPVLLADKEDRKFLFSFINNLIEKLKIRDYKEENVLFAFKNVFERALISKKELSLILGLFSKIDSVLKNMKLFEKK